MDIHSFASLAQVRILVLPVGSISKASFEKWAAEIRSFEHIQLGDIPQDNRDERGRLGPRAISGSANAFQARFMPNPLSAGYMHLSFPAHPPPPSHSPFNLFRPSHFPLGVIGIAECSPSESLSACFAQFNASLADVFKHSDSNFPLARSCFVFEEDDGSTNLNVGDQMPGLVVIPSVMGHKRVYISTLIADLCSQILGEFSILVRSSIYTASYSELMTGEKFGIALRYRLHERVPLPQHVVASRLEEVRRFRL